MILQKKKDDLCCPSTGSLKVQIKFRYLSCLFSAIIILTSKFFLRKTVNISEDRRHIYLLGQPLTKFNDSTCEVKLTAGWGRVCRWGFWISLQYELSNLEFVHAKPAHNCKTSRKSTSSYDSLNFPVIGANTHPLSNILPMGLARSLWHKRRLWYWLKLCWRIRDNKSKRLFFIRCARSCLALLLPYRRGPISRRLWQAPKLPYRMVHWSLFLGGRGGKDADF